MEKKVDRAAQFGAFDALKGLPEELESRVIRHNMTYKRQLYDERKEEISRKLSELTEGMRVRVIYYSKGYYLCTENNVVVADYKLRCLQVGDEPIAFEDIYDIIIL